MTQRVVFDTNVVLSALLFPAGRLAWLRGHWASGTVSVLGSKALVDELIQALAYPKFQLSADEISALLADYLPFIEVVEGSTGRTAPRCRDTADQKFIELALAGRADILVSGDKDLHSMKADTPFAIETPQEYAGRFR